jgi:hypothetical protein
MHDPSQTWLHNVPSAWPQHSPTQQLFTVQDWLAYVPDSVPLLQVRTWLTQELPHGTDEFWYAVILLPLVTVVNQGDVQSFDTQAAPLQWLLAMHLNRQAGLVLSQGLASYTWAAPWTTGALLLHDDALAGRAAQLFATQALPAGE